MAVDYSPLAAAVVDAFGAAATVVFHAYGALNPATGRRSDLTIPVDVVGQASAERVVDALDGSGLVAEVVLLVRSADLVKAPSAAESFTITDAHARALSYQVVRVETTVAGLVAEFVGRRKL